MDRSGGCDDSCPSGVVGRDVLTPIGAARFNGLISKNKRRSEFSSIQFASALLVADTRMPVVCCAVGDTKVSHEPCIVILCPQF